MGANAPAGRATGRGDDKGCPPERAGWPKPVAVSQANTFQDRAVRLPKICGFCGNWLVGR